MNILQNRIDSYKNNLVKWPHNDKNQYAKVESFAKAGFYFVRRPKASDSVRCFICDIEISHWRPNQSPFVRHGVESPQCAWKRLNFPDAHKKPLANNSNANGRPRSTLMRTARLATFNNHKYWPPKKGAAKYPTGAKLAGAGFFFSPTASQPSKIKCAYCGVSVAVTPNVEDMLNKHQELSSDCAFFEQMHDTRTSNIKADEPSGSVSAVKRRISAVSSSSSEDNSKKTSSKRQKDDMAKLKPVIIIESKKTSLDKNTSVLSSPEASANTTTTRPNKKANNKKQVDSTDDSIWDFDQILISPPKPRRPMVTFGSKKSHRSLSSRNITNAVNILPDFKSPLIIKPTTGPLIEAPVIKNTTSSTERPKIAQPTTRRLLKDRTKSPINKSSSADTEINIAKKRNITADTETSTSNKHRRLKVAVNNTKDHQNSYSSLHKPYRDKGKGRAVEYNLTPSSATKKPISLSRSQTRLLKTSSIINNPLGDRSNLNIQESHHYIPMVSSSNLFAPEGSNSKAPTLQTKTCDTGNNISLSGVEFSEAVSTFINNNNNTNESKPQYTKEVSLLPVAQDTKIVSHLQEAQNHQEDSLMYEAQDDKETSPLPMAQKEASPSPISQEAKAVSPKTTSFNVNLKETAPVEGSQLPVYILPSQSPIYMPDSPSLVNISQSCVPKSPSPVYIPDSPSNSPYNEMNVHSSERCTPPANIIQASDVVKMEFLTSTPMNTQSRIVSGFDIFGANPLSPIVPRTGASRYNELPSIPIVIEGRQKHVVVEDEEGKAHIVRIKREGEDASSLRSSPLSDCLYRRRGMSLEEQLLSIIEDQLGDLSQHSSNKSNELDGVYEDTKIGLRE